MLSLLPEFVISSIPNVSMYINENKLVILPTVRSGAMYRVGETVCEAKPTRYIAPLRTVGRSSL